MLLATSRSYNPTEAGTSVVWAPPRSLATTGGIIIYFLFLEVLRCFSSLRSPLTSVRYHVFNMVGCPIRKSQGQRSFAPHPGLSQLITSFIACESQGIRHAPFPTFSLDFLLFLTSRPEACSAAPDLTVGAQGPEGGPRSNILSASCFYDCETTVCCLQSHQRKTDEVFFALHLLSHHHVKDRYILP